MTGRESTSIPYRGGASIPGAVGQIEPFLFGRGQRRLPLGQPFRGLGELGRRGLEQVGLRQELGQLADLGLCLLYTSPSPRD